MHRTFPSASCGFHWASDTRSTPRCRLRQRRRRRRRKWRHRPIQRPVRLVTTSFRNTSGWAYTTSPVSSFRSLRKRLWSEALRRLRPRPRRPPAPPPPPPLLLLPPSTHRGCVSWPEPEAKVQKTPLVPAVAPLPPVLNFRRNFSFLCQFQHQHHFFIHHLLFIYLFIYLLFIIYCLFIYLLFIIYYLSIIYLFID